MGVGTVGVAGIERHDHPGGMESPVPGGGVISASGLVAGMERGRKASSAFRTISEVADELGVQQHVLRFWETKFSHVRPLKRGGGRRYYRPEDVALLKRIHHLLYTEGYTIKGVQKLLREVGKKEIMQGAVQSVREARHADVPRDEGGRESHVSEDEFVQEGLVVSQDDEGGRLSSLTVRQRTILRSMLDELKELRAMFSPQG